MENRVIYTEKKACIKYDNNRFMLYLNEEIIPDYVPETSSDVEKEAPAPVTGYAYTGNQPDGGTLIEAQNNSYDDFVSGLIKLKYSVNSENAIQANMMLALINPEHARAKEFQEEWNAFQAYREECKTIAKSFFE